MSLLYMHTDFSEAGEVVCYSHLLQNFPQFVVIHTVKGIVNKIEVDIFLELSCFFDDPKARRRLLRIPWTSRRSNQSIQKQTSVGSQCEALRPWQRSWGRRLDICKDGIEPQESPRKSSSIYPHNQSLPTLLLCALTYTSDFTGGCPPPPLSEKELT